MKKETQFTIMNNFVWALAVIGWVFMISVFLNSYNELTTLSYGIAPPFQIVGLLISQTVFYGFFVVALPIIFIINAIEFIKGVKNENIISN